MSIAIDCKQTEYMLCAIAPCEVAGVAYGPGDTILTATKRVADRLVAAGSAVHSGGVLVQAVVEAEAPVVSSRRVIRKKAGKAKP